MTRPSSNFIALECCSTLLMVMSKLWVGDEINSVLLKMSKVARWCL